MRPLTSPPASPALRSAACPCASGPGAGPTVKCNRTRRSKEQQTSPHYNCTRPGCDTALRPCGASSRSARFSPRAAAGNDAYYILYACGCVLPARVCLERHGAALEIASERASCERASCERAASKLRAPAGVHGAPRGERPHAMPIDGAWWPRQHFTLVPRT